MHFIFINILINIIIYIFTHNSYIIFSFILQGILMLFYNFISFFNLCDFFCYSSNIPIIGIGLNFVELKSIIKSNFNLDYNELHKNTVNSISKLLNNSIDNRSVIILTCFTVYIISVYIIINTKINVQLFEFNFYLKNNIIFFKIYKCCYNFLFLNYVKKYNLNYINFLL